ncbi:response regulator [Chondrinema litorale]|uniref:response regulator n=1 Tax=Chondrinema litorale TaxID=2994555 RepID=UPI000C62D3B6|nr:response regulator [Chondrinema litorale]MBT31892.1 histidine kinase [Thalassovita sp.]UZR94532.1 response regulator [Chondrinema litorale]
MTAKKILVAEDSSVIQNITKKVLQFQNFDIKSAKNGQQVLKMIEKEDFAAILMDINMPILDGMSCAKKIRSLDDSTKANVPIIAITGNAQNYTMDDFKDAGINDYLPKPLNFDKLVLTVKKYAQ